MSNYRVDLIIGETRYCVFKTIFQVTTNFVGAIPPVATGLM